MPFVIAWCRRFGWALLGVCALSAPRVASAEPEPSVTARADAHFRRGVELAKDGDFGAAALEFEAAQGLSPHPTVLFNLGQAYARSGHPVRALRALEEYLKEAPRIADSSRRHQAEGLIGTMLGRVGWLKLTPSVAQAHVLIDGREDAPAADGRVMLAAGRHSLVVHAPGHQVFVRDISIEARRTLELEAPLVANETTTPGLLDISCATPDAVVELDGRVLGTTPIADPVIAPAGTHRVKFARAGYAGASVNVEVKPGARARVACKLVPNAAGLANAGRIAIKESYGLDVNVDGSRYRGERLPAGRHSVSFGGSSFASRLVRVEPGETVLVDSPLTGPGDDWRVRWGYGLAIAGGALLVAGATIYLVNTPRHHAWEQRHDDWASSIPRAEDAEWLAVGVDLDRDRADLQRVDLLAASLASAGAGAAATGFALWWTAPEQQPALRVHVAGASIGLSGAW